MQNRGDTITRLGSLPRQSCDCLEPGDLLEFSPDDIQASPAIKARKATKNSPAVKAEPAVEYKRAPDDRRRVFIYEPLADQVINEIMERNSARLAGEIGAEAAGTFTGVLTSRRQTARHILERALRDWKLIRNQRGQEVPFSLAAIGNLSETLLLEVSGHIYQTSMDLGAAEKKRSANSQSNISAA